MRRTFWALPGGFPWAAFAFGRRGRFFEAGEVRLAILSQLEEGPKHGYQLMKEMKERSGGVYSASAGSVYPTLQQLEDEGLVDAALLNGRRTYNLTPAGRAELAKDPESVRQIWERAERCEDWSGPLTALMRASLQAASTGKTDRVRKILDRARREIEAL
jgi:DNA-binding PadR family transcriptional regulator